MSIYGSGSPISPSASAYAEFEGAVPTHFSFGVSNAAYALASESEFFETARLPLADESRQHDVWMLIAALHKS